MLFVDFFNRAQKVGKRTVGDFDSFADGEVGFEFGGAQRGELHNGFDFRWREGGGFGANANETGDTLGGTDDQPGIVVYGHFDQEITGEDFFANFGFFAVADDDFVLGGDHEFEELVGLAQSSDSLAKGFCDTGFVAGVGVDDVPVGRGAGGQGIDNNVAGDGFAA